MPTRRARFTPPPARVPLRQREIVLPLQGGFHGGVPHQNALPGFSPRLQNLVPEIDGYVTPRSGLSLFDDHDFGGAVLGAFETFDVEGNLGGVAASAVSLSFLHPDVQTWSHLSYVQSFVTHLRGNLSGLSTDYFEAETIYDDASQQMICVLSNNTDSLKFFEVTSTSSTFSDFTWADSIDSTMAAKDIASVNNRLVLFNTVSSDGTRYPTRVISSARGIPKSFLIADGAVAEDLVDMRGSGQAVTRFRDFLLLFTELEIWRATPTLDDYAFRFARVVDNMGTPWPRTIAVTPEGVIFLGRDREVHITDGSRIVPLGPLDGQGVSRIQRMLREEAIGLERAWGIYNQTQHRYELYFPDATSPNGYPSRSLFYSLTDRTWWPQKFTHGLSAGVDLIDPAELVTWDSLTDSWDVVTRAWDSFNIGSGLRRPNVFSSAGSTFRFFSTQTSDDGEAIDWRWRSPGVKGASARQVHLKEIWMDYEEDSASSASVFVGSARSGNDLEPQVQLSLTSVSDDPYFMPVWKTDHHPLFEIRGVDGGRPRLSAFVAVIQDASKF